MNSNQICTQVLKGYNALRIDACQPETDTLSRQLVIAIEEIAKVHNEELDRLRTRINNHIRKTDD